MRHHRQCMVTRARYGCVGLSPALCLRSWNRFLPGIVLGKWWHQPSTELVRGVEKGRRSPGAHLPPRIQHFVRLPPVGDSLGLIKRLVLSILKKNTACGRLFASTIIGFSPSTGLSGAQICHTLSLHGQSPRGGPSKYIQINLETI